MGWRPSGRYTPAAVVDWKILKMVLIIPYKHDKIPLFRFSIPSFHYSCLEYAGWVLGIP